MELNKKITNLQEIVNHTETFTDKQIKEMWESFLDCSVQIVKKQEEITDKIKNMEEFIQDLDEDLALLEENYYQTELLDEENEEGSTTFYELCCPNCKENLCIEEVLLADVANVEVLCPTCGEEIHMYNKKNMTVTPTKHESYLEH